MDSGESRTGHALPSGTITFLFTDIEGSTRLWAAHPDRMGAVIERHDALLREAIEARSGYLFKTVGDAVCAAFPTALDGLRAAVDAQRTLAAEDWGPVGPIRVRMALHSGGAELRGGDYFGPTLNRVARLLGIGHGGQVLVSLVVEQLVRGQLPEGVSLRDLGEHRLKDLSRRQQVFDLAIPGLPSDFPALTSLDALPNNLPAQLTQFVGREREMATVRGLLADDRLVTLMGFGGTGKTRLALQVAADQLPAFPDGVWLIELAPLTDAGELPQALASAIGIQEAPGTALADTLLEELRSRSLLLVLDNCEHLIDASARWAERILRTAPGVRILATSREALAIAGERTWPVPPLARPARPSARASEVEIAALEQAESVQLFLDRARLAKPGFGLDAGNAAAVAEVCLRLDGVPLAIELAAARIKMMSPDKLAERLDNRFALLKGGSRTAMPRQQTLRAAIDWSYELLDPAEAALFRRLSVFAGGWTLEAAEQVCADEDLEDWEILDYLSGLVDKSFVLVEEEASRQALLESLRAYGHEKLEAEGEDEAFHAAHGRHYLAWAERAEEGLVGERLAETLDLLEAERHNVRTALAWAARFGELETALRVAGSLFRYWFVRGHYEEGRDVLRPLLEASAADEPSFGRAKALHADGTLAQFQGALDEARASLEEALALWRALEEPLEEAKTLNNLATVEYEVGRLERVRELLRQSLELKRDAGDRRGEASGLNNLGILELEHGDCAKAEPLLRDSLRIFRRLGDENGIAKLTFDLATVQEARGALREAESLLADAKARQTALGDRQAVAATTMYQGLVAYDEGDYEAAARWYREALATARELGRPFDIAEAERSLGDLAWSRERLEAAVGHFEEALRLQRSVEHLRGIADSLDGLGRVACARGDLDEAARFLAESLRIRGDGGLALHVIASLESHVRLAVAAGDGERAILLAAAAAALRAERGVVMPGSLREGYQRALERAREAQTPERIARLEERGAALGLAEAAGLALGGPAP